MIRQAASAARGHRLFLVVIGRSPSAAETSAAVPAPFRRVDVRRYRGIVPLLVLVYEPQTAIGA